jgi:hypothetical protein
MVRLRGCDLKGSSVVLVAGVWAVLTGCGPHDTAAGPTSTAAATALIATFPLAIPTATTPVPTLAAPYPTLAPHATVVWLFLSCRSCIASWGMSRGVTAAAFRVAYGGLCCRGRALSPYRSA